MKSEISSTIEAVRSGELDRGTGAVLANLCNVLLRALEIQRKWHEVDDLERRLRALEEHAASVTREPIRGGRLKP